MVITEDTKQSVVEFYKTNSTTITCEQFHITWDTLKKVLTEYGIAPHDAKTNRELTSLYRFGVTNAGKSAKLQEKAKQTTASRYGNSNYRNNDKARQTRINTEGSLEASYKKAQKKQEETNLSKYGVKSYFQAESFQQQAKDTCIERYGKEFYRQTRDYQDSVKETSLKKYGVEHYTQSGQYKTKVRNTCQEKYGSDSWFGSDAGKSAIKNSCLQKFGVANVMQSLEIAQHAKETITQKYGVDKEKLIFDWCKSIEFPYPNISSVEASYKALVKADVNKFSMRARYGMRVIDAFHKSIWKANRKGFISPYDAWQDEELLRKCIKNRIIYKGTDLDPSKVLYGFSAAKIAPKVSVFNPYLAKYLISKYLNDFTTIFDPCSGYSGRLLGATSLGKCYIGQDINAVTIEESLQICDALSLNAKLSVADSLNTTGSYEALFTCTPYSDKENWDQKILNLTCDEWIDRFLENYKCKRYVFVVDRTEKYKDYIVEELVNKSHLNTSKEYALVIEP